MHQRTHNKHRNTPHAHNKKNNAQQGDDETQLKKKKLINLH